MKKVQAHFVKKVQTHLEAARVVPLEKQADYLAELCSREPFLGRTVKSLLEKEIHRKERDTTSLPIVCGERHFRFILLHTLCLLIGQILR